MILLMTLVQSWKATNMTGRDHAHCTETQQETCFYPSLSNSVALNVFVALVDSTYRGDNCLDPHQASQRDSLQIRLEAYFKIAMMSAAENSS